ncbi:hypothetical protein Hanom_Chr00s000003g01604201 [Helianthus anomalus]
MSQHLLPRPTRQNMFILFRKHLFWFSFIFIYLINTTTLAQPPPLFHHISVNTPTYTLNTPYQSNLDTVGSGPLDYTH